MTVLRYCCYLNLLCGLIYLGILPARAYASSDPPQSLCTAVNAQGAGRAGVVLLQHTFEGGFQDLAIAFSGEHGLVYKRVTFGGPKAPHCHYQAMGLAKGGDWGWHITWVAEGSPILYYARMDGEAWVSSPTKKLNKNVHIHGQPLILTDEQKVWIVWYEKYMDNKAIYAVYSGDEGRSWNDSRLLLETSSDIGYLRFNHDDGKPSLIWGNDAERLPLPEQ